jgi:hypothetical protein
MKASELDAGLGASGRQCDHSICPTRKEGHMRRRPGSRREVDLGSDVPAASTKRARH